MDQQMTGSFIARQRKSLGLTQAQLAEKIHVTDKAVSKWERGIGLPDIHTLEPLANALKISIVELLQGKLSTTDTIPIEEAEDLVSQTIQISKGKSVFTVLGIGLLSLFGLFIAFLIGLLIAEGQILVYSVGSLITGLIAWAAPIWQLAVARKRNVEIAGSISFGAALCSLVIQFLQLAQNVNTGDYAAIEDTSRALCIVVILFSCVTLLLNLLMHCKNGRRHPVE